MAVVIVRGAVTIFGAIQKRTHKTKYKNKVKNKAKRVTTFAIEKLEDQRIYVKK